MPRQTPFAPAPPIVASEPSAADTGPPAPIGFRDLVAIPAARLLLRRQRPVKIGGRAFDLLIVLLRSRGSVVSKNRIMQAVWPGTFVAEGNLRFQMAMLRKALGHDRDLIKTVIGRGYMLADERRPEPSRSWTLQPIRVSWWPLPAR
jgi:DNA-binding response OmpR family regulator